MFALCVVAVLAERGSCQPYRKSEYVQSHGGNNALPGNYGGVGLLHEAEYAPPNSGYNPGYNHGFHYGNGPYQTSNNHQSGAGGYHQPAHGSGSAGHGFGHNNGAGGHHRQ